MNSKPGSTFKIRRSIFNIQYSFESGFTLVELLVVIAIISLLLSILTPSLMKAKSVARRVKCVHNLKQIDLAMHLYLGTNDNTYPCAPDPVSKDPSNPYWLWMGRGWRRFVQPYLECRIDVNNPSVLLCPSDRSDPAKYESTSYSYTMAFYHSPERIDSIKNTRYTYDIPGQPSVAEPSISQTSMNVAKPSGKILIGEWFSNHYPINEEKGWWNGEGCRNYLFADGQVCFLKANDIRTANDGKPNPNLTIHGIKGIDYGP